MVAMLFSSADDTGRVRECMCFYSRHVLFHTGVLSEEIFIFFQRKGEEAVRVWVPPPPFTALMTRHWTGRFECVKQELYFWYAAGPNPRRGYHLPKKLCDCHKRDDDPRFDHVIGTVGAPHKNKNNKAASARVNKKFGNKDTRRRSKWSKQRKRKAAGSWRTLLAS